MAAANSRWEFEPTVQSEGGNVELHNEAWLGFLIRGDSRLRITLLAPDCRQ